MYLDVNKCGMLTGGCQHQCINTNGSYFCRCNDGFFLNGNGKTCTGKFKKCCLYRPNFFSESNLGTKRPAVKD